MFFLPYQKSKTRKPSLSLLSCENKSTAKNRFHSSHHIQIPLLPPQSELPITATCKPILAIKPWKIQSHSIKHTVTYPQSIYTATGNPPKKPPSPALTLKARGGLSPVFDSFWSNLGFSVFFMLSKLNGFNRWFRICFWNIIHRSWLFVERCVWGCNDWRWQETLLIEQILKSKKQASVEIWQGNVWKRFPGSKHLLLNATTTMEVLPEMVHYSM